MPGFLFLFFSLSPCTLSHLPPWNSEVETVTDPDPVSEDKEVVADSEVKETEVVVANGNTVIADVTVERYDEASDSSELILAPGEGEPPPPYTTGMLSTAPV